MEVSCSCTPDGNFYLFYRVSANFARALRPIIPFLLAGHAEVLLGHADASPGPVLRLGPIGGDAEARLLRLIDPYLVSRCPPVSA